MGIGIIDRDIQKLTATEVIVLIKGRLIALCGDIDLVSDVQDSEEVESRAREIWQVYCSPVSATRDDVLVELLEELGQCDGSKCSALREAIRLAINSRA